MAAPESPMPPPPAEHQDQVWQYRGYNLRPSEFTTAMVHYYRAEIQRSNAWRTRLDATTNWAVIAAGAAMSFSLSSPTNHFGVIVLDTLLVTLFLWIEARRYRYYELWSYRARLLETDFFAAMLVPPFGPRAEWGENLAESLLQPEFPITMWEAFGRRLRRNYLWIFLVLALAWALKTMIHPTPVTSWTEFVARSAIGTIPGGVVLAVGAVYNTALLVIAALTSSLHQSSGEVLPKVEAFSFLNGLHLPMDFGRRKGPTARRRKQLLALVISSKPEAVAQRVLKEMRRGATALHGKGMYTQSPREVLMLALTVTELEHLKALVSEEDPDAFIIVSPAQEVLGKGFQPLQPDQTP